MTKLLNLSFTGNAALTPEYPDNLKPITGPLKAIMPGARRQRPSLFDGQHINSQFVFLLFPFRQLVVSRGRLSRSTDYKHPNETAPETGVCFFESEQITIQSTKPPREGNQLYFVEGDVTKRFPKVGSKETAWIARWTDFSFGYGSLKPETLTDPGDYVRMVMNGGIVSAGVSHEPIARLDFDYDRKVDPFPYAQQIVLTMTFDDDVENVDLVCTPFSKTADTTTLTFTWGGRPSIDLFFGNGSLASLQSVLAGSVSGHDHEGDFDVEFDVMLDIIKCRADAQGRQPLPHIRSAEVSHVPCTAAMVAMPSTFDFSSVSTTDDTIIAPADTKKTARTEADAQRDGTATFLPRKLAAEPRQRRGK